MSKMTWIIILVACGIGLAVLVGVLGTRNEPSSSTSKAEATSTLCTSLKTLDSSVKTLTGIDTSTATKSEYQADVTAVQNAWNQVTTDAKAVQNARQGRWTAPGRASPRRLRTFRTARRSAMRSRRSARRPRGSLLLLSRRRRSSPAVCQRRARVHPPRRRHRQRRRERSGGRDPAGRGRRRVRDG